MNFGEAIHYAKAGKKVARTVWGDGIYAYIVPAQSFPAVTEIAKQEFGEMVPYREYWAINSGKRDVMTWAPSGSDSLAEDWVVVDTRKTQSLQEGCDTTSKPPVPIVNLSKLSPEAIPYVGEILNALQHVHI